MVKLPSRKVCGKVIDGVPMVKVQVTGEFYWYSVEEVAKHREGSYRWDRFKRLVQTS